MLLHSSQDTLNNSEAVGNTLSPGHALCFVCFTISFTSAISVRDFLPTSSVHSVRTTQYKWLIFAYFVALSSRFLKIYVLPMLRGAKQNVTIFLFRGSICSRYEDAICTPTISHPHLTQPLDNGEFGPMKVE